MDFYQLKYFRTIAECQNLTKASKELHVSQPSLSRCIKSLEEELGTPLFDRVGRNIILNDAGRIALDCSEAALKSVATIKREIDDYLHEREETINFFAPVPLGDNGKILVGFKRQNPDIRLRIATIPMHQFENETPDLMFFASPIVHSEANHVLLAQEDIVLAASMSDPVAQCESVRLADMEGKPFAQGVAGPLYEMTKGMFLEAGFEPRIVMEDQDCNRVMAFAANDFGYVLAPAITWYSGCDGQVARVPLEDVHRRRYLYLRWPENAILSHAALLFRDYIVDYYRSCPVAQGLA